MNTQGKLSRRGMLKMLGAGAGIAVLSACQPGIAPAQTGSTGSAAQADAANLTYWFFVGGPNLDTQKKLVEEYNSTTKGAKVTLEHTPEIKEKTLAAYAAGAPPNVTWYPTGGWGALGFANTGGVIELDDYVAKDYADQKADFYDFLWQANVWKGKLWGMPLDTNNLAWFYNEDKLTEAGVKPLDTNPTWDELVEMLKAVTKPDQWGYQVSPEARYFYDFLKQAGGELANEDYSKTLVNSPEGEATLKWLRDMVYEWKISPNPPMEKGFETGSVVFEYEGSYRIPPYRQLTDIKVSAMRTTKNKAPFTVNGGESLQIWKTKPEVQDASWDFIKWMTSTETVTKWSIASGYLPVRKSAAASADFKKVLDEDPLRKVFVDELEYGGFWLATPFGDEVYSAVTDAVQTVLLKDANIKETLGSLETKLNDVLAGKI
ncbi:MAG: extracellular solute-binding protein [Chloroflexi bacterium]|nr:extracellular solute-binding protein [Chloroflexota bacterium]